MIVTMRSIAATRAATRAATLGDSLRRSKHQLVIHKAETLSPVAKHIHVALLRLDVKTRRTLPRRQHLCKKPH